MKKEKLASRVLNCKIFYIILSLLLIIHLIICFTNHESSSLDMSNTTFEGVLKEIKVSDEKTSLLISLGKEEILCNYYDTLNVLDYPLGITVSIEGFLQEPSNNTVPNNFNYKKYLYYKRIYYVCTVKDIEVTNSKVSFFYKIKNIIIRRIMTFDIKDYLYTMIIGNKSLMDESTYKLFQENGITHLFAISGMHISLFSMVLLNVLKRTHLKDKTINLLILIFIWFYAFLAGFSASVLRASLLFSLVTLLNVFNVKISSLKALFLTGAILLFFNYRFLMDNGFQYSFVITFGLIMASAFINKHKVIGTSLVATLFGLPLSINNYYKVNFLSFVNNILFVPLVSLVIYPLCLLSFVFRFIEPICKFFIWLLETLSKLCASVTVFNINIPKLNIIIFLSYYLILIFLFNKHPGKTTIFLISIILLSKIAPYLNPYYIVTYIDVSQGDSSLIISPYAKEIILIDTGGVASSSYFVSDRTITYLNSLGINKINYLILSHGDYDHMGDAINLVNNIKVENVIFNNDSYNELETELIEVLKSKNIKYYKGSKELNIGNNKLQFLNTKEYDNENDNSNVIYFKLNNSKFLFMGDVGTMREKDIVGEYKLENIDFIKIGHHGSNTSSSKYFISGIKPKNCLISVGKNNRYGHPKDEVLDILDDYCEIYRTDINGSVEIKLNKNGYKIKTYNP